MKVYTLDAFTSTHGGGNPAGVVLDTANLTEADMLHIAKKVGFSETAFVFPSEKADFCVRFFTPTEEVDLCGHATIATFKLLLLHDLLPTHRLTQETLAGLLAIDVSDDGIIRMQQTLPEFGNVIPREEIAPSLRLDPDDLSDTLPVEIVSTGLADIMIPVKSRSILKNFVPDFEQIKKVSQKYNVIGYHVFSLETQHQSTAACRNLAPLCGIDEEAATGTSNGALSCYLYKHRIINEKTCSSLRFEQGMFMDRPSQIMASLHTSEGRLTDVFVGGDAVLTGEKIF